VYRDTKAPGLQLRVTANGVKTFSIFRRIKGGPPERITLDRFPTMTVERARDETAKVNGEIASRKNPAEVRRAIRGEPTFANLFEAYLERHSKPRKRTWREDETKYRDYLAKPLGGRKVSHISRQQVAHIHERITADGHAVMANRVLALVSSVFGWGISKSLCEHNPAKGIKRNSEIARERFLQADELPRFFKSLASESNKTMRDYFLLSLLTGARRSNTLAMRWADINMERAEWRIGRTKNGQPQSVALVPEAIAILHERVPTEAEKQAAQKEGREVSSYVFPSPGDKGHLVEPRKGWERIFDRDELEQLTARLTQAGSVFERNPEEGLSQTLNRARAAAKKSKLDTAGTRIVDLRIHDLRRSLGSWQAKTGASLAIIGKSLSHKTAQATSIYARLDLDPVRESVERATSAMLAAAGVKKEAEVRKLKSTA
jgi:integrase